VGLLRGRFVAASGTQRIGGRQRIGHEREARVRIPVRSAAGLEEGARNNASVEKSSKKGVVPRLREKKRRDDVKDMYDQAMDLRHIRVPNLIYLIPHRNPSLLARSRSLMFSSQTAYNASQIVDPKTRLCDRILNSQIRGLSIRNVNLNTES
jgi:hypothetical protein